MDAIALADQIEIFSGAEAIVGPMGTCLLDAMFAPPDCRVVEIVPEGTIETSRHVQNVCEAIGQDFTTVSASIERIPGATSTHDFDFMVDPERLAGVVARQLRD